jgi:hypothetical protein
VGDTLEAVLPDHSRFEDPLTDEELTALALGSEPLEPLPESADDIAPSWVIGGNLPLWYMPPVARHAKSRWAAPVVVGVISAFLLIDAMGLCNTYGLLSL